jgi:hypothetical protein
MMLCISFMHELYEKFISRRIPSMYRGPRQIDRPDHYS